MIIDSQGMEVTELEPQAKGCIDLLNAFYDAITFRLPSMQDMVDQHSHYPHCPMVQIGYAMLRLFSRSDQVWQTEVKEIVEKLILKNDVLNHREQLHVKALQAFVQHRYMDAINVYRQLLTDFPKDLLVLPMLNLSTIVRGYASVVQEILDSHKQPLEDDPRFFVYYVFYAHLVNKGNVADLWERLQSMAPDEPYVHHIGAHVLTMTSGLDDAIDYLERVAPTWQQSSDFILIHNGLHLGLLYAWNRQEKKTLEIFLSYIWSYDRTSAFTQMNAALYLWYLDLAEIDASKYWPQVAEAVAQSKSYDDYLSPYMMMLFSYALRRGGHDSLADEVLLNLESYAKKQTDSFDRQVWLETALLLAQGASCYAKGDYAQAIEYLKDVYADEQNSIIGCSDEQRFVFTQTYWLSLIHCGHIDEAKALIKDSAKGRSLWPIEKSWLSPD